MARIKVSPFGGMIPAIDDRLIADNAAAFAENAWLYAGTLRGLPIPKLLHTCATAQTGRVYRIPNNYVDAEHIEDAHFMEFENFDTDVRRSPVVGDTFDRYYWASPAHAPRYNTLERIRDGDPHYILGIPAPTSAPVVEPDGNGSGDTVSRSYVVTFVSAFGEEGPPSAPHLVSGKEDDTWAITLPTADPDDVDGTNRLLEHMRIYRTITSEAGVATYFFVAEVDIDAESYDDTDTDETVSANEQLQSTSWTAPPSDLVGWVAMPNGMFVGWRKNELWFSEPYRPHAWPAEYTLAVEYPIVGLGVVNQTLVICTAGSPQTGTGLNPESFTLSKLANFEPCLSRGSIVSAPEGVYYASPNGLVLVNQGVATVITKNLITKDRWQQLAKLATLRAARLGGAYYAYGSVRLGVFETTAFELTAFTQEDFSGARDGILIDASNERVAFGVLADDDPAVNVMDDPWTNEVFIIRDNKVYWLDFGDTELGLEALRWRSKIFQTNDKRNIGAVRIFFRVPEGTPAQNSTANNDLEQELDDGQYGLLRIYADGRHVYTRELRESGELIRPPSGFKADFWQFELETRVEILSLHAASTVKELQLV